MHIVVTGASGFIGQAVVPALRGRGHAVVALDRAVIGDIAAVLLIVVRTYRLIFRPELIAANQNIIKPVE